MAYLKRALERIAAYPGRMMGKPVIKGTRVPVALVLNLLAHGYTPTRVIKAYPQLTLADVEAAREYAPEPVRATEKVYT